MTAGPSTAHGVVDHQMHARVSCSPTPTAHRSPRRFRLRRADDRVHLRNHPLDDRSGAVRGAAPPPRTADHRPARRRRATLPVDLELRVDRRFPECAEVAAYYVVAEALTNATKYARASEVNVCVEADGANLRLSIRDNGIGGAHAGKGSGLIGLIDRVEALGGTMKISSRPGNGTSLLANIPFEVQ